MIGEGVGVGADAGANILRVGDFREGLGVCLAWVFGCSAGSAGNSARDFPLANPTLTPVIGVTKYELRTVVAL